MHTVTSANPTDELSVSFREYVQQRKSASNRHLQGGIADYAFGSDFSLRQKIRSIPGFYALAKSITNVYVPQIKQQMALSAAKVGPTQFPEIYNMVTDCAKRLGIGIPSVYIVHSPGEMNAYAMATEDDDPLIYIYSSMVERFTSDELKAVIGHECGHIHNNHGIFNTAANLMINASALLIPGVAQIVNLLSTPLALGLKAWSRAAEVTCDRAGIICSDEKTATVFVQAKLQSGAVMGSHELNPEALIKQYDSLRNSPMRFSELLNTHPSSARRIIAAHEFLNSEVLYSWRPEWKEPGMELISKQELDSRCEQFVSVFKSKKWGEKP